MERLPFSPSHRINRERELSFTYQGHSLKGLAGDTIATALFANGERIFSRSLKYHRPRGLYNLDGYSSHCLMSVDGEPNIRACATPLRAGMGVKPQNVLGSPAWDLLSVLQWFSFAMPLGFYYRKFHKPAWIWPYAQNFIRRVAGLGALEAAWPDDVFENQYLNAEVCVIGGGPAGMQAALAAARPGVRVILLEAKNHLGGALDYRVQPAAGAIPGFRRAAQLAEAVLANDRIQVLLGTAATSIYQSNQITAIQNKGPGEGCRAVYYEIRAKSVVAATGAIERPLLFDHNDVPGIMQGSCAQQLVNTYALKPGCRAVLSGAHDGMLEAAVDLAAQGVEVAAVADARTAGFDDELVEKLRGQNIPFYPGYQVAKAKKCRTLKGAVLRSLHSGERLSFPCDVLAASAGVSPLGQLLGAAGARFTFEPQTRQFLPTEMPQGIHAAGRVLAQENLGAIEAQGRLAGLQALQDLGIDDKAALQEALEALETLPGPPPGLDRPLAPGKSKKCFICFDEDVTIDLLPRAIGEGFDSTELLKRYSTVGTGPSQSYLSGSNFPLVLAELTGQKPGALLPTTVRPPVVPASLAALAGRGHAPTKKTPLHAEQQSLAGTFKLVGVWERVRWFDEPRAVREIQNVHENVGFIDVSTLGKFRLFGPDAEKLLQRVYAGDMSTVTEGRLKYAAMCNEQGIIIDDGVVTKLGPADYFFTTSSLRAANTAEWLGFHSKEENWEAYLVNLTDAFAAINIAGPKARDVLTRLTGADVSNDSFPYMGFRQLILAENIPAYVYRVGFVGELSYEVHVPAAFGPAVHRAVLEAGRPWGIEPFGMEAQFVLRLEKGHVIIGTETDNHSTLHDVGLGWAWDRKKTEAKTVGAPALRFTEEQTHRQKLVAFKVPEPAFPVTDGAIVVDGRTVRGRVCSVRFSPTLQEVIGMALVDPELAVMGGPLEFYMDGRMVKGKLPERTTTQAVIVKAPFYDPKGERLKS